MNMKKIISLSFAALSVAGALSACSDSSVSGADVQGNSVALSSSSVGDPGSSSSINGELFKREREESRAALVRVRAGTAVTYSHIAGSDDYQTDSVTAHETFDRTIQSILDIDPTVRYSEEAFSGPMDYFSTFVVMKDEDGLVHGEIIYHGGELSTEREINVGCGIDNGGYGNIYEVFFNSKSHPYHVPNTAVKYMRSMDSTVRAEFRKDCALENGEIDNGEDGDPQIVCLVKSEEVNGVETYKDPNWKKYAKFIIDDCVSTKNFDELYGRD